MRNVEAKDGNPSGPFWDYVGVDEFAVSLVNSKKRVVTFFTTEYTMQGIKVDKTEIMCRMTSTLAA